MKDDKLKKIIQSIGDFPTLPSVVAKVMQVLNDPYSSASDLTELISVDQAMTFRILKMANSAFYGFPRSVATVTESIVLLGFATVRNLILTTMMFNFDQLWTDKNRIPAASKSLALNQRQTWRHSVATAIMARQLLSSQGLAALEHVGFLAGLMHDVGKTLFYHYFHDQYLEVVKQNPGNGRALSQLEAESMGAHHGQVGGWIVDRWNLPEDIVAPITFHHFPEEAKEKKELTQVLYIANRMAHETLKDLSDEEPPTQAEAAQWWTQLGLSAEQLNGMSENLVKELAEIENYVTA